MKFTVLVKEIHFATFKVEAESVEEALSKAEDLHNDDHGELEYLETLSKDRWDVRESRFCR